MNFAFSDEQELLRRTARDVFADAASLSIAQVRALNRSGADGDGATHFSVATDLDDVALWRQMAELGFLGLPFAAAHGGSDGSFMDLAVILEELGRAVGPPAYMQTVALCGMTIAASGPDALRADWLQAIVEGRVRLSAAIAEEDGIEEVSAVRMHVRRDGDDFVLDGIKRHVEEAGRVDAYLVATGSTADGITLFLVDSGAPGITLRPQRTTAGGARADIHFDAVRVPASRIVGEESRGETALQGLLQRGAVAACLDMVGAGEAVLEMAVAYAAERVQFGKRIGSFQAVQHHASNMAVDVDASRLITYQAAWKLSEGLDAAMEVAMAKAWTGEAYRRVCTLGHQIFGGIGLMREHDMHLFLRRSRRDDLLFGDAPVHLDRLAAILDTVETPWPQLRGYAP
ncbi:MAG TPA: acyl-CoA dehydrogenase family protein [Candidatus Dormibacteraeota bacterium]|nr:acyl-CoA dehydrogenase family protein [Candidatus Dormibacteraeota bacterium]